MASATGGLTSRPVRKPFGWAREQKGGTGYSRVTRYAVRVIPWIIFAVVVVPLAVVGFVATRRRTAAGEHPASEDAKAKALTEQEFAEAEAYEAKWHEEDKKRYHEERLP
jgi:hypothetical protein